MTTYRLGSAPMIYSPGIVRMAQHGYKDDPGFFKNLLVTTFPTVPPQALTALLQQRCPERIEGETLIFDAYVETDPTLETEEEYWEALECMPPARFGRAHGMEMFHICEHLDGNLVNWHVAYKGKHYQFNADCNVNTTYLAELVRSAAA